MNRTNFSTFDENTAGDPGAHYNMSRAILEAPHHAEIFGSFEFTFPESYDVCGDSKQEWDFRQQMESIF